MNIITQASMMCVENNKWRAILLTLISKLSVKLLRKIFDFQT